jgi:hypothetical protein
VAAHSFNELFGGGKRCGHVELVQSRVQGLYMRQQQATESASLRDGFQVGQVRHELLNNRKLGSCSLRKHNGPQGNGRLRHQRLYAASGMAESRDGPWHMTLVPI